MTTVAYRDGVLAADSRAIRDGWIMPLSTKKIFSISSGELVAIVGALGSSMELVKWIENGKQGPQPSDEDCVAILVRLDGVLEVYESKGMYEDRSDFIAFGSGSPPAMAALHMGASAAEAVRIASLVDPNTGGPVETLTLFKSDPPLTLAISPRGHKLGKATLIEPT